MYITWFGTVDVRDRPADTLHRGHHPDRHTHHRTSSDTRWPQTVSVFPLILATVHYLTLDRNDGLVDLSFTYGVNTGEHYLLVCTQVY